MSSGPTIGDNADQRFYASSYGRFNSPDLKGGRIVSPATLNRYAYVGGDPTNQNDPLGLCAVFLGGFTSNYNPGTAFTQIASAMNADQAYPYSGLSFGLSASFWQGAVATQTAMSAIVSALQQNSGQIDIVAWSGGSQAFTNAYNQLSSAQQQRIGNIIYVGPGTLGTKLASNASTTVLNGNDLKDVGATLFSTVPTNVSIQDVPCGHGDFACFVRQAQTPFAKIQSDGGCNSPTVYDRSGQVSIAMGSGGGGSYQSAIQNTLSWLVGLPDDTVPVVTTTISYEM